MAQHRSPRGRARHPAARRRPRRRSPTGRSTQGAAAGRGAPAAGRRARPGALARPGDGGRRRRRRRRHAAVAVLRRAARRWRPRRPDDERRAGPRAAGAGPVRGGRQAAGGGVRAGRRRRGRRCAPARQRNWRGWPRRGCPVPTPAQWYATTAPSTERAAVVGRRPRRDAVAVDAADAGRLPAAVAARTPRRQRRPRRALRARHAGARAGVRRRARPRGRCWPSSKRSGTELPFDAAVVFAPTSWTATATMLAAFVAVARPDPPRTHRGGHRGRRRRRGRAGGDGQPGVRVRGRVDRLERDAEGRLVVVDVKTGKSPVSKDDAQRHAQLAMYQLAIAEGVLPQGDEAGGGRLVYLGKIGAAGATERDQDPMTADGRDEWRDRVQQAAGATQGPGVRRPRQRRVRALPGAGDVPRPGRVGGTVVTAPLQPGRTGRRARHLRAHRGTGRGDRRAAGPAGGDRGRGGGQDRDDGRARGVAGRQRLRPPRRGARADVHPQGGGAAAASGPHPAGAARGRGSGPRRPGRRRRAPDRSAPTTPSRARCCASTACCCRSSRRPG